MICFFDTNILVYVVDQDQPIKREQAIACLTLAASKDTVCLSTQVLAEFYNACTRRLQTKIPVDVVKQHVQEFSKFLVMPTQTQNILTSIDFVQMHKVSWWDALILEAALRANADVLYSEDFQHGRRFGKLAVENPFL